MMQIAALCWGSGEAVITGQHPRVCPNPSHVSTQQVTVSSHPWQSFELKDLSLQFDPLAGPLTKTGGMPCGAPDIFTPSFTLPREKGPRPPQLPFQHLPPALRSVRRARSRTSDLHVPLAGVEVPVGIGPFVREGRCVCGEHGGLHRLGDLLFFSDCTKLVLASGWRCLRPPWGRDP